MDVTCEPCPNWRFFPGFLAPNEQVDRLCSTRPFRCSCALAFCALALASAQTEESGTNGRSAAPRTIYIFFEGTAQGGEVSIRSLTNEPTPHAVESVAGETAAQVVAKLAAVEDARFLRECKAQGHVLKASAMSFPIYCRSTDPGIPARPSVRNLSAQVDKERKVVTIAWDNPDPAPTMVLIYRNWRGIWGVDATTTSYEDKGVDTWGEPQFSKVGYHAIARYEKDIAGQTCYAFSDIVSVTAENPWYDPNDEPPSPNVPPAVPNGKTNTAYSYQMKDYRLDPTVLTWTVVSGTIPPGLTLTQKGLLAGTPTKAGEYRFEVKVTGQKEPSCTFPCKLTVE